MLELDAENPATLQKYAEILISQGERDKSFDVYTRLTELLKARGNHPAFDKITARVAILFPDRMELSLEELASLVKSDVDNAIAKLSGLIKQDNSKLDLWKLLVEAYQRKGDDDKLRLTYDLIIRMFPTELFARQGIIGCALKAQDYHEGVELLGKHASAFMEQEAFHDLEDLYLTIRQHIDDSNIVEGLKQLYQATGETEKLALLEGLTPADEPLEDSSYDSQTDEAPAPPLEPIDSTAHASDVQPFDSAEVLDNLDKTTEDDWEDEVYISIDEDDDLSAELPSLGGDALPPEEMSIEDEDESSLEEIDFVEEEDVSEEDILCEVEIGLESLNLDLDPEEELDTEELDTEELDTEEIDTEEIDTEEIDTEEIDTEEIDTEEIDTEEIDTEEIDLAESDDEPEMELSTDGNGVDFEEDGENCSTFELTEDELEVVEPESDTVPLLELEENSAVEDETLLLDPEESEESTELALTEELDTLLDDDEETLDLDISKGMDLLFDQFDDCLPLEGEPVVEGKLVRYSWMACLQVLMNMRLWEMQKLISTLVLPTRKWGFWMTQLQNSLMPR